MTVEEEWAQACAKVTEAMAARYSAIERELLFWIGFPGYLLDRHDPLVVKRARIALWRTRDARVADAVAGH